MTHLHPNNQKPSVYLLLLRTNTFSGLTFIIYSSEHNKNYLYPLKMSNKFPNNFLIHSKLRNFPWLGFLKDLLYQIGCFVPLNNKILPMLPGSDPWAMFLIETVQPPVRTWFIFTSANRNLSKSTFATSLCQGFGVRSGCEDVKTGRQENVSQPNRSSTSKCWHGDDLVGLSGSLLTGQASQPTRIS